jgi:hypothetical protein
MAPTRVSTSTAAQLIACLVTDVHGDAGHGLAEHLLTLRKQCGIQIGEHHTRTLGDGAFGDRQADPRGPQ